ncbi:lactadherin-like [Xenia sp. Carnegie-2017]|uniref:lactadherin-like n=1 Tax=Xenia sp. Carnegie-2017 TaxID=2897299 RepID=UPI001F045ACD|nr:lactadherin-like [Xenia sp. Carnegie-2017]
MKVKLHGCSYVCQRQLFFSSPSRIKDYMISASSAKYPKYEPKQTAIEGHAWCSVKNDKKQWIQFKFPRESKVSTILTFGDRRKSYVKSYYMQFSDDGENWSNYVQHGTTRIFQGNNDANSPVRHTLANEIEATYVRVLPVSWKHNICMRISLLGCYADCSKPLLASGRAVNPQFDSSVQNSHPEYALFNTGKAWCTGNTPNEYLQIKFGEPYILYKIATLPSPVGYHNESGLSQYTLKVRKGGSYFVYGPRGKAKIFVAINENDPSRPMIHDITDFMRQRSGLRTKAIRIYPQTNDGSSACIRVELYGCLSGVEILPTTPPTTQKVVNVSLRFTSLIWNDKLSDPKSEEFIETSKLIIKAIESVFTESESFRNAKVLKFIKGSVVATIELVFNPIFVQGDNATSLLESAVHKGKIGSLRVDPKFFNVKTPESSARTESDSRLSGGIIALIVLILLLAVALISALAFFVYRRRKQNTFFAPKHFDNPVSFSSKACDMDD